MNLPITLDDSIPQQAGPGAGADKLTDAQREKRAFAAVCRTLRVVDFRGEDDARYVWNAALEFARAHLAAPLAVEDSRERCASSDAKDAARYRWLRRQHWDEGDLCVVERPRDSVKLGYDCPNYQRLDTAIDAAMAAASSGKEN